MVSSGSLEPPLAKPTAADTAASSTRRLDTPLAFVDGEVIGAVGASGGSVDDDIAVARAALAGFSG
jgi:hypothetical protein